MRNSRYRLMHQVVPGKGGRPRIQYMVVLRAGGLKVAGPYDDWRMAQREADRLENGPQPPAPQSDYGNRPDAPRT